MKLIELSPPLVRVEKNTPPCEEVEDTRFAELMKKNPPVPLKLGVLVLQTGMTRVVKNGLGIMAVELVLIVL